MLTDQIFSYLLALREMLTRKVHMEQINISRRYLNPEEVATYLGIGRSKAYSAMKAGEIPCVRIGKLLRVSFDALKDWETQNLNKPGTASHRTPARSRVKRASAIKNETGTRRAS